MMRNVMRLLVAVGVAIVLALGTTAARAAEGDRAPSGASSARAAGPCAEQRHKVATAKSEVKKANRQVKNAKRAKNRADTAQQKQTANKKLKRAKKHQKRAKLRLARARAALQKCQDENSGGTGNPLQPLCDALPQLAALCETDIPLPPSTGDGSTSPLAPLCEAVPEAQPLCDATSVPPGPGEGSPLQPLCDAVPEAQPLCDATGGGLPDPGDNPLCDLPIPLPICDLLGGRAAA
jgi:hypothetical protein